jgi:hypothetical protein
VEEEEVVQVEEEYVEQGVKVRRNRGPPPPRYPPQKTTPRWW